jgi:DNA-directed RNA polymerase subunit K/omega
MHHLDFEKVIDKLGSKYEAVVRMTAIAKKLADGEAPMAGETSKKVTSSALHQYLQERPLSPEEILKAGHK